MSPNFALLPVLAGLALSSSAFAAPADDAEGLGVRAKFIAAEQSFALAQLQSLANASQAHSSRARAAQDSYERALIAAWTQKSAAAPPQRLQTAVLALDYAGVTRTQADLAQKSRALSAQTAAQAAALAAARAEIHNLQAQLRAESAPPRLPLSGKIIQPFSRKTKGVRIAAASLARVRAPASAKVLYKGALSNYGQVLILETRSGYSLILAGMAHITASTGQQLHAGQLIGRMGKTPPGRAAALYFEVQHDGESIDPERWVKQALKPRSNGLQLAFSATPQEW